MNNKTIILECVSKNIKEVLMNVNDNDFGEIQEIRLRVNKPLIVKKNNTEYYINHKSRFIFSIEDAYKVTLGDLTSSLSLISGYSLYAFEEEIRNGFITIKGGHRVGICGKAVVEKGEIKTIKNISALSIRIAHEIKGCAEGVLEKISSGNGILHTLILSPPGCGKTTLIRDLIRTLSNKGLTIGLVDERSEIAACFMGIPQKDVGLRTDVLDNCPKALGMKMLLRGMCPDIIAADEIGKSEDISAISDMVYAGVKLICSVHGEVIRDLYDKPMLSPIIEKQIFNRIIVLSKRNGPGTVEGVYDENGILLQ